MKRFSLLIAIALSGALCFVIYKALETAKEPIQGSYYIIKPEIYY